MCVIFALQAGVIPTVDEMQEAFRQNSDGVGITDGVLVQKFLPKSEKEMAAIRELLTPDRKWLVHFRFRTHGSISKDNVHPFQAKSLLHKPIHVMHNGCFPPGTYTAKGEESDTAAWVRKNAKQIHRAARGKCELDVPIGNKVAFFDPRGEFQLLGLGWVDIRDGFQASNDYWQGKSYMTSWSFTSTNQAFRGHFAGYGYDTVPRGMKNAEYFAALDCWELERFEEFEPYLYKVFKVGQTIMHLDSTGWVCPLERYTDLILEYYQFSQDMNEQPSPGMLRALYDMTKTGPTT